MNVAQDSACAYQLWIKNLDESPDLDALFKMMGYFESSIVDMIIVFPDRSKNKMDVTLCVHLMDSTKKKKTLEKYVFTRWRKNFFAEKTREMVQIDCGKWLPDNFYSHLNILSFISDVINNKDELMKSIDTHLVIDVERERYEIKFVGIDKISLSTLRFIESFKGQANKDKETIGFKADNDHVSFTSLDKTKIQTEMTISISYF
jgi:hypothetical protein